MTYNKRRTNVRMLVWAMPLFAWALASHSVITEHDAPAVLEPGEAGDFTWTIEKGGIEGFARLQMEVPDGLTLKPGAFGTQGATFSFEGNLAKWIWMDLPSEDRMTVQAHLTAGLEFNGGDIRSIFSFISEGKRVDHPLPKASIKASEARSEAPITAVLPVVRREVVQQADDLIEVTVVVTDYPLGQFLKFTEFLPNTCVAEPVTADGAVVTHGGGELKWVWFETPKDQMPLTMTYLIMGSPAECIPAIHGELSFVEDQRPVTLALPASHWSAAPVVEAVAEQPVARSTEPAHIGYRVQLLAAHRYVSADWVKRRFQFSEGIDIEEQSTWVKYTTGSFAAYRSARNKRNSLGKAHDFPGPFVTAYLDGERISVQEALLISHQHWMP